MRRSRRGTRVKDKVVGRGVKVVDVEREEIVEHMVGMQKNVFAL